MSCHDNFSLVGQDQVRNDQLVIYANYFNYSIIFITFSHHLKIMNNRRNFIKQGKSLFRTL